MAALGYPCAKISLKEDDVPTLFPVVEAMLMPPMRRTSTITVHLGSKRAVSADTGDVGEFDPVNSDSIFLESSARNSGNFGLRGQRAQ